ncbi:hypothetical protein A2U01_0085607, partial [Trifolium medium]|nr:hypothetical protein [Trifolium medium]
ANVAHKETKVNNSEIDADDQDSGTEHHVVEGVEKDEAEGVVRLHLRPTQARFNAKSVEKQIMML